MVAVLSPGDANSCLIEVFHRVYQFNKFNFNILIDS